MVEPIPDSLLRFATEFSSPRTPHRRTKGAGETARQRRGEPDELDTVASLMVWRKLTEADLPVTFFLTARTGDESDIRVKRKGRPFFCDINVKATKTEIGKPREKDICDEGFLPVKAEELGLQLDTSERWKESPRAPGRRIPYLESPRERVRFRVAAQENGRVDAFLAREGGPETRTRIPSVFVKVFVHLTRSHPSCIDAPHVHFCRWMSTTSDEFSTQLDRFAQSVAEGQPTMIWGINHPGLWVPAGRCRPFGELVTDLAEQFQVRAR